MIQRQDQKRIHRLAAENVSVTLNGWHSGVTVLGVIPSPVGCQTVDDCQLIVEVTGGSNALNAPVQVAIITHNSAYKETTLTMSVWKIRSARGNGGLVDVRPTQGSARLAVAVLSGDESVIETFSSRVKKSALCVYTYTARSGSEWTYEEAAISGIIERV